MKVKMIVAAFNEGMLETTINKWLEKNQDKKVLDIKPMSKTSAMVIYEEN